MNRIHGAFAENGLRTPIVRFGPSRRGKIYRFCVPRSQALDAWKIARSLVAETGYWPVILGEDGDLARHERSVMKAVASPAEIVAESERIDCQRLTTRILEELIEDAAEEDGNPDGVVPHGPWPEQSRPMQGFSILH